MIGLIREIWEIWYWGLTQPSRLNEWMLAGLPEIEQRRIKQREGATSGRGALLTRPNQRFIAQYLMLMIVLSLPLVAVVNFINLPPMVEWAIMGGTLLIAYVISLASVPLGLHVPLTVGLFLLGQFYPWAASETTITLPFGIDPTLIFLFLSGWILGTSMAPVWMLGIKIASSWVLGRRIIPTEGNITSTDTVFLIFLIFLLPFWTLALEGWISLPGAISFMLGWPLGMSRLVPDYLIWSERTTIALMRVRRGADPVTLIQQLPPLSNEVLHLPPPGYGTILAQAVHADPVVMQPILKRINEMSRFTLPTKPLLNQLTEDFADRPAEIIPLVRLLYLQFSMRQTISDQLESRFQADPLNTVPLLRDVSELFRPGDLVGIRKAFDQLVVMFRDDWSAALPIYQEMRASGGLSKQVQSILPQIVADQFAAAKTLDDVVITATTEHPVLPVLLPAFYQREELGSSLSSSSTTEEAAPNAAPSTSDIDMLAQTEIGMLVPRLQIIAGDIGATLEGQSATLRLRRLETIRRELVRLREQLISLGLDPTSINRWRVVINHWSEIVDTQIQQDRSRSQGELVNPFTAGNPLQLDAAYLFKGRRHLAEQIVRQVLDKRRPTLVLHGPRRIGKTSFLINLPRLLPRDVIPVYIDLQPIHTRETEADFWYTIARSMYNDSRKRRISLPDPDRAKFDTHAYAAIESWLDQVRPEIGSCRMLLNLDEWEKLGQSVQTWQRGLAAFDQLRHMIQHDSQIGFLFSGVETLEQLGPNWSSYFISVVPMEILYLERDEAEDLLRNPDPDFDMDYEDGVVERVLAVTCCHPYLIQLLGEQLVTEANLRQVRLCSNEMLDEAIYEVLDAGEAFFNNIWVESTGKTAEEQAAGQQLLSALALGHDIAALATHTSVHQAAMKRLRRLHVIQQTNGMYHIEVPLVERWIRERGAELG